MSLSAAPDVCSSGQSTSGPAQRFVDATPALSSSQALIEAERCLYCHDAPCTMACPTGIDVPSFIRRIADGNVRGAARTILEANPLGGICARVCPTEELCEAVCVRNTQQGVPVSIGRLQRHAVEAVMDRPLTSLLSRRAPTGKRIAVVGAGPAGLSCAHALALKGHDVVVLDAKSKGGGLNEYGLAAYKTAGDFAQRELQWLLSQGGITLRTGVRIENSEQLMAIREEYDAVFLGVGLGDVNALGVPGESVPGVRDAVDFIAEIRQASDLNMVAVGRRVVVIGGGMTAVDAAVQSRLLGAQEVSIVYRRGPEGMSASGEEQRWAQTHGVTLHHWLAPTEVLAANGRVSAVVFARQAMVDGRLIATGDTRTLDADLVLKAIGQTLVAEPWSTAGIALEAGRIAVDGEGRTSLTKVWAGGDCRAGGRDLTVEAVEDGKRAAASIHAHLN